MLRPAGSIPTSVGRQCCIEVLDAIAHLESKHRLRLGVHRVRDHGATLVVGNAKAWLDVFARHAAQWKERESLTGLDHRAGVVLDDRQRRALGDVAIQLFELVGRLGCVDDSVRDLAFVGTFFVAFS